MNEHGFNMMIRVANIVDSCIRKSNGKHGIVVDDPRAREQLMRIIDKSLNQSFRMASVEPSDHYARYANEFHFENGSVIMLLNSE